mmetsp:Transcript_19659/g.53924  ORF Transcript_19659/g.53924 Transcript_19659/m.53924 type:complete len:353 (-) Transcript_19659:11-1069(-)
MFGRLKLAPGAQGGGIKIKKTSSSTNGKSSSRSSSLTQWKPSALGGHRPGSSNSIDTAIRQQVAREKQMQLPDWIQSGVRVGYMSRSSGKLCEVVVESVSHAKNEVKITFAEDREVWKCIPFSMILSRSSPLRRLAEKGAARNVNEMLHSAQASSIDKGLLLQRVVGQDNAVPKEAPAVSEPLIGTMTKKVIPDSAITASSYFMNSASHGLAQMGCTRIDSTSIAWRPASDSANQCIRWNLGSVRQITKVQTKGSPVGDHWVTSYKLSYTTDGTNWMQLSTAFAGNEDKDTLAENAIEPPIVASIVRLHPMTWHGHIGIRAELLGFTPEAKEQSEHGDSIGELGNRSRSPRR